MQYAGRDPDSARHRYGQVWPALAAALSDVTRRDGSSVLDCGGGSGSFAVPLAGLGARVTVVDISADALATLRRRAEEAGVAGRIAAVQGDVDALGEAIGTERFDLVLAHGVLEAVDRPASAFLAMAGAVRPGGLLSVLVGNPVAGVIGRAMAGDLETALRDLRGLAGTPTPGPDTVRALCQQYGLLVEAMHGIGVFTDLVPGRVLGTPAARATLADLDDAAADRPPLRDIAARVHLLARRPEA